MLDTLGLSYGMLVQVSVHGTDNSILIDALKAYPKRLRGVAAVAPDVPPGELDALHQAGIRGARIVTVAGTRFALENVPALAARIERLGWHLEFALHGAELEAAAPMLLSLPVPIVLSHFGDCDAGAGTDGPQFRTLAQLVRSMPCFVKLSGAYRLSAAPWSNVAPLAAALVELAPHRLLWGSDWPHVAITEQADMPATEDLLDLLPRWVEDPAVQHQILVDNPAKLYGVPG